MVSVNQGSPPGRNLCIPVHVADQPYDDSQQIHGRSLFNEVGILPWIPSRAPNPRFVY